MRSAILRPDRTTLAFALLGVALLCVLAVFV
jgi:hypothetical protein